MLEKALVTTLKNRLNGRINSEKQLDMARASTFSELCAIAGQQRSSAFSAADGCTKTLKLLLEEFKNQFDGLDQEVKKSLGLENKRAQDITHFDLLEIGLYGKIHSDGKSPAQILFRNQNVRNLYLEEHVGHHEQRDGNFISLIRTTISHKNASINLLKTIHPELSEVINPDNLYTKKITVTTKRDYNTEQVISRKIESDPTDSIFYKKIDAAIVRYEKSFTGFAGFFRSQSTKMKEICSNLKEARRNQNIHTISNIMDILNKNKNDFDSKFKNILIEMAIMTKSGNLIAPIIFPEQKAPDITILPREQKMPHSTSGQSPSTQGITPGASTETMPTCDEPSIQHRK